MLKKLLVTLILVTCAISTITFADSNNIQNNSSSNLTNVSLSDNATLPAGAIMALTLPQVILNQNQEISRSYSIRSGFAGSTTSGSGDNQSPAATMTFSDKSSVSGNITKFMKSFTYLSGISV